MLGYLPVMFQTFDPYKKKDSVGHRFMDIRCFLLCFQDRFVSHQRITPALRFRLLLQNTSSDDLSHGSSGDRTTPFSPSVPPRLLDAVCSRLTLYNSHLSVLMTVRIYAMYSCKRAILVVTAFFVGVAICLTCVSGATCSITADGRQSDGENAG